MHEVLTDEEMDNLQHMLGVRSHVHKRDWGFRNYYCASIGSKQEQELLHLVQVGFVMEGYRDEINVFFHATELGCFAAGLSNLQTKRALGR